MPIDKVREPEFARRLNQACENNPHAPPKQYGQLTWMKSQLDQKFGRKVTVESVRKWFAGESVPRRETLEQIAEILQVDPAWLLLGKAPNLPVREQKIRDAQADGVVNVLAGVIQIEGGHPAFPEVGEDENVDLYAIIRGAQYRFRVALGEEIDGELRFTMPPSLDRLIGVCVVMRPEHRFEFYEVDQAALTDFGKGRGGYVQVAAPMARLRRIKTFAERL